MKQKIISLFQDILSQKNTLGVDHLFLSALVRQKRGVNIFKAEVDSVEIADEIKIGVWAGFQNRWGTSVLESLNPDALKKAVLQAKLASTYNDADPDYSLAEPTQTQSTHTADPEISKISMGELEQASRDMESKAQKFSPLIKNIPDVGAGYDVFLRVIANSNGLCVSEEASMLKAGISVMAQGSDGRMVNVHEMDCWTRRGDFNVQHLVDEVLQEVTSRINPHPVATGSWPVIFDPRSAVHLLGTFTSIFSGDALYRHLTRLEGKLGEAIASSIISLSDSASNGLIPHTFDAEGSLAVSKKIIDNGIFKTFLHNRYTSKKVGTTTTGNAGGGLEDPPSISTMNLSWESSQLTPQIQKLPKQAILIREMAGASASAISGDFSYGALGYWVEDGVIQYPIADFTIAGNFFELLKKIQAVGDDLRWFSPHLLGSMGGRSLLIDNLSVSGK
ncbi:MAG: TldD/PmbA family protein [Deltaproteobacteria bacterium]|nr:MAG: TldD/PmbA family protein [Deltaproteobacteria bacterium]